MMNIQELEITRDHYYSQYLLALAAGHATLASLLLSIYTHAVEMLNKK